jgi:hypothetical protein
MKSSIPGESEEAVSTEEEIGQEKEEIIDNVIQEMEDF